RRVRSGERTEVNRAKTRIQVLGVEPPGRRQGSVDAGASRPPEPPRKQRIDSGHLVSRPGETAGGGRTPAVLRKPEAASHAAKLRRAFECRHWVNRLGHEHEIGRRSQRDWRTEATVVADVEAGEVTAGSVDEAVRLEQRR